MNKYLKMKKCFIFAMTIFFALSLCSCHESLEKRCARESKEYTQKYCPAPVGKNMIIDSMCFDPSTHTLLYYYSLKDELDNAMAIAKSKDNIRKQLLQSVKSATSLKTYKDEGYNFSYTYYSSSNPTLVLYKITFKKKDYK